MKSCFAVCVMGALLVLSACDGTPMDDYVRGITPTVTQYNSARDIVDQTIQTLDSATTPSEYIERASQGVRDLERAIQEMNTAYRALGNQDIPEMFHEHQEATLAAWRAGIEATITIKLFLEKELTTGQSDDSLLVAANRLFAEEDRYQLEARRALQAGR